MGLSCDQPHQAIRVATKESSFTHDGNELSVRMKQTERMANKLRVLPLWRTQRKGLFVGKTRSDFLLLETCTVAQSSFVYPNVVVSA